MSQLSLEKASDTRRPLLLVRGLSPQDVFDKLNAELQRRSAGALAAKIPE